MNKVMELSTDGMLAAGDVDNTIRDTPERRLLVAVIHRALTDLLCQSDPKSQLDAKEWFQAELVSNPIVMSFQFICLELDLDAASAQKAVLDLELDARAA